MRKIKDILSKGICEEMKLPFSEFLREDELRLIYDHTHFVSFKDKEVIIRQGTPVSHVMYIKSGFAKIYKEGRHGNFIILKLETEGNFLGLLSVFANEINKYSVSSVESTEVGFINIEIFNEVILKNGRFAYRIISSLSSYGLYIFERLISQSHKQLPGRIADVLLYFSEEIYQSEKFDFPFTRKELAELAGTTKESFIRTLTEFKNDKIINIDGSHVEIVSMENVKLLSRLG